LISFSSALVEREEARLGVEKFEVIFLASKDQLFMEKILPDSI